MRTPMCWETACLEMSKNPAISDADISSDQTKPRIVRRCGSANALNAASTVMEL